MKILKIEEYLEEPIMEVNSYLLHDGENAFVIDVGVGFNTVCDIIEKENLKLKYIFLTHGHFDHILEIDKYKEKFKDVKIVLLKKELDVYENRRKNYLCFSYKYINAKPDILLEDMDEIKLNDNESIKIIHTSGHTEGSAIYHLLNTNIIFTGDTIFNESIGRCDLLTGSMEDMRKSLKKIEKYVEDLKKKEKYDDIIFYPGHGENTLYSKEVDLWKYI